MYCDRVSIFVQIFKEYKANVGHSHVTYNRNSAVNKVNIDNYVKFILKFNSHQSKCDRCTVDVLEDSWHIHIFPGLNNSTQLEHHSGINEAHQLLQLSYTFTQI